MKMDLIADIDEGDDLPTTQPIDDRVLKDVVAYVEVRSANDNRSSAIRRELEQLGAVVIDKFTDIVTHVIFKEGSQRTKNKAKKMGIHLVSVLWVDSCKRNQEHVSEKLFPANLPNEKGTPTFVRAKLKKAKSMQPVDFNDDVANSAERCTKRKIKRLELVDKLKSNDSTPVTSPLISKILVLETQPRSPLGDLDTPIRLTIPDTPASMKAKMKELQDARLNGSILGNGSGASTPVLPSYEDNIQKNLFGCFINGGVSMSEENDFDHEDKENPIPSPVQKRTVSLPVQTNTAAKKSKRSDRRKTIATITLPTEEDNKSVEKLELSAAGKANTRKTSTRRKSMSATVTFADEILDKELATSTRKKQTTGDNKVLNKDIHVNYTDSKQVTEKKAATSTVTFAEDLHIEEKQTKSKRPTRRKSVAVIPQSEGLNEMDSELPKIVSKRRGRRSMGNVLPGDLVQAQNLLSTSLSHSLKVNENSEEEFSGVRSSTNKRRKSSGLVMDNFTTTVESHSSESNQSKFMETDVYSNDASLPENDKNLENQVEKPSVRKSKRRSMVLRMETSSKESSKTLQTYLGVDVQHSNQTEKFIMPENSTTSESLQDVQDSDCISQIQNNGINVLNKCDKQTERQTSDKGKRRSVTKRKSSVNSDKSSSLKSDTAVMSANSGTCSSDPVEVRPGSDHVGGSSELDHQPLLNLNSDQPTENVKITATLKKRNSKKKLLTVNDLDPNSFLIEPTVCSDKVRPALLEEKTGKRKRKLKNSTGVENEQPVSKHRNGENSASGVNNNNTCVRKSKNQNETLATGSISNENTNNRLDSDINSNVDNNTHTEYTSVVDTESSTVLSDISLTAVSSNNDMSMSVAFDDNTLPSILGRLPPRPSINEFNLRKFVPRVKGRQRLHHSDSSVLGKENSDGAFKSSDSTCTSDSDSGHSYRKKFKRKSGESNTAVKRSPHRPSLVMTSLHTCEQDIVISVLRKLGGFVITDNVTDITSHVICGGPRRTLNVLHAMALGCWLVKKEWIIKSLEAGRWLPEEEFEASDWFPAAKIARGEQEDCKEYKYRSQLLSSCGFVFVCPKTLPPRNDLISLIKRCSGKVTSSISKADIFIGNDFYPDKTCVKPLWLLDCITQHELLSTEAYCVGQAKRESSPEF